VQTTGCRRSKNRWNWDVFASAPQQQIVYASRFSLLSHHPPAAGGWTTDETWTFAPSPMWSLHDINHLI
jgi:hypothetical protein